MIFDSLASPTDEKEDRRSRESQAPCQSKGCQMMPVFKRFRRGPTSRVAKMVTRESLAVTGAVSALVLDDALDDRDQGLRLGETEGLLPEAAALVADDEEVLVGLRRLDVVAELAQGRVDVLLGAGEEVPARTRLEAGRVLLELGGRVVHRVDADREEVDVLAEAVAEPVLDLREVGAHDRAGAGAAREHEVDDHDLAAEEIAVQAPGLPVLVDQGDLAEVALTWTGV